MKKRRIREKKVRDKKREEKEKKITLKSQPSSAVPKVVHGTFKYLS